MSPTTVTGCGIISTPITTRVTLNTTRTTKTSVTIDIANLTNPGNNSTIHPINAICLNTTYNRAICMGGLFISHPSHTLIHTHTTRTTLRLTLHLTRNGIPTSARTLTGDTQRSATTLATLSDAFLGNWCRQPQTTKIGRLVRRRGARAAYILQLFNTPL